MKHLVGRQGQPRGAQVQEMQLSDWKGVEAGSTPSQTSFKGWQWMLGHLLLDIPAFLRPSKGKQLFSFISVSVTAAFGLVLICCS